MGESKLKQTSQDETLMTCAGVQTVAGRVQIRWEPKSAATPMGQLAYFIEFLTLTGLWMRWLTSCPLTYLSHNAPTKADVLGTWMLSVLSGHKRYSHVTAIRCDGVNPGLLEMNKVKRRFKVTTDSKHNLPVAPNLLDRNFTPDAPNQVWASDITYLWTDEGWLYLAIVLDLFNREVVGWSLKPRMTADIVTDALTMAWFRRKPAAGLIHHSDRGSQYASHAFQARLKEYGMTCSMSRKGNCWDNAPSESWFGGFKNERVYGERFETQDEVIAMTFEYIEVFYNRRRLHSTLGYKSPMQFLSDWLRSQPQEKQVA